MNNQLKNLEQSLEANDPNLMDQVDNILSLSSKPNDIARVNKIESIVNEGEEVIKKRIEFE